MAVSLGAGLRAEAVARAQRVVAVAECLQLLGEVRLQPAAVLALVSVQVVDGALELTLLLLQRARASARGARRSRRPASRRGREPRRSSGRPCPRASFSSRSALARASPMILSAVSFASWTRSSECLVAISSSRTAELEASPTVPAAAAAPAAATAGATTGGGFSSGFSTTTGARLGLLDHRRQRGGLVDHRAVLPRSGTLSGGQLGPQLLVLGEKSLELGLHLVKEGVDLSDVVALPQSDGRELLRADVIRRQRHLSPRLSVSWRSPRGLDLGDSVDHVIASLCSGGIRAGDNVPRRMLVGASYPGPVLLTLRFTAS